MLNLFKTYLKLILNIIYKTCNYIMAKGLNFYEALFLVFLLLKLGFEYEMTWFEVYLPFIAWALDTFITEVCKLYKVDQKLVSFYMKIYLKLNDFIAKRHVNKILKAARKK